MAAVEISKEDLQFYISGISSGYPFIDYLTGVPEVFFPFGVVTELMGLKSTSKSTIVLEAIAKLQKSDLKKKVAYFDFERSLKKQVLYANALGVDMIDENFFEYYQPQTFQEGANLMLKLLRPDAKTKKSVQDQYALIVIDTVAAMRPTQELENKFGETKQQGLRGKLMSELLRNLTSDLNNDGPAIVFVNQIYEEININKGPMASFMPKTFDSSASNALKYYASFRVQLTLKSKVKSSAINPFTFEEEETFVGSVIEAMAEKSKVGVPFRKSRFYVRYGYGIDPIPTMIAAGIAKPQEPAVILVEGKNSLFSYHIGKGQYSERFKGMAVFQAFLANNKDQAEIIAKQLSPEWFSCIKSITKQETISAYGGELKEESLSEDKPENEI